MLGRMFWARAMGRTLTVAGVVVLVGVAGAKTQITIWGGAPAAVPASSSTGGVTYGGYTPTQGAYVVQQRDVDLPASPGGEIRFTGVPATVDAASVHLTADGVHVVSQRFVPGAKTPTEALARGIGGAVTVVTTKGEVAGVLRAVDDQTVVVELAGGGLSVMRRDGFVQDIRLANAPKDVDKPSLVWRVQAKQAGKHPVEVAYRADGMAWSADYLAVLDDSGTNLDFSAWASIKNATTAQFDDAELVLVTGATTLSGGAAGAGVADPNGLTDRPAAPAKKPVATRFVVPGGVTLGAGETVQVELLPPKVGVKARTVVSYEAQPDQSDQYQDFPNTDCSQSSGGAGTGAGVAEVGVEVDLPPNVVLPAGRVRLFQKKKTGRSTSSATIS